MGDCDFAQHCKQQEKDYLEVNVLLGVNLPENAGANHRKDEDGKECQHSVRKQLLENAS